jgi:catechol 2,3-dioxygenase-like lactoylglutathione lyase family enzyme
MSQHGLGTNVISQIAIVVRDIEKTARQYADIFNLPVPPVIVTDTADKAHTNYRGHATQARAKLAFFQMGPQLSIELIEPLGGPSTWQEFLDARGEGVHHIAFNVPDMDQSLAYLDSKGIQTVQRGDFTGGCYGYADATGPLKVTLELLAKK